jgi:cobyrinic acid a,c-diamide synthase
MPPMISSTLTHGVIVSAIQSGSGKTAVTCSILAALQARGADARPFKVGPDFIDPQYHHAFGGRPSFNLDLHLLGDEGIRRTLQNHAASGIAVVEGVMGLFDGISPNDDSGSTAHLAEITNWPVLLVLDASGGGRTLAKTVQALRASANNNRIAGVILTKSTGPSHADYLRKAFESCEIPFLGALPKSPLLEWPSRYLGLTAPSETKPLSSQELAAFAAQHLDLSAIRESCQPGNLSRTEIPAGTNHPPTPSLRVALARDAAFHFIYPAWEEWFVMNGFRVSPFSPLDDPAIPHDADALFIPGGFPERFADQLSQNSAMRASIQRAIQNGLPTYAECGGLMYLTEAIVTEDGKSHPMCGVIPGQSRMSKKLQHFGYCFAGTSNLPGHEFHRSEWTPPHQAFSHAWDVTHRRSGSIRPEGFRTDNLHASYVHLHPATAGDFVRNRLRGNRR